MSSVGDVDYRSSWGIKRLRVMVVQSVDAEERRKREVEAES